MVGYPEGVERLMRRLFDSLKESDRRRYAAIEAAKLGHGGVEYIATVLGCDPKTIRLGLAELEGEAELDTGRIAQKGGGRKRLIATDPAIEANFLKVLEDHTAGDPMRLEVRWTNLSRRQIAGRVTELGTPVSRHVVSQLLRKHRYRRRKALKKRTMGPRHPDRNAQFENIARLKREYLAAGLPVVSIDTKKKELIGDFYREGAIETQATIEVNDHDFGSMGSGTVIPHGIYDVGLNRGFVHLNTSHDTSELACDSLAAWWEDHGRSAYPRAAKLLVLCDGGGSNSASRYVFKEAVAGAGGPAGGRDPGGALPAVLLEVQPDRASAVPARDAGVSRRDLPDAGDGPALHVEGRDDHGPGGRGADPREGVRDGPEVRRGVQGDDEDRLRRVPAQVELPGRPRARVRSGSYSRPVP